MFLDTERLILTHWQPGDAVLVKALHSQLESVRYLADGQPWTLERAEERMASWIAEFKRDGIGMLKLVAKDEGRFIGRAGIHYHRAADVYGLSFSILPEEAGKGYATEIGRALMAWFATSRPTGTLRAASDVNNLASLRVLEKMGMQEFELENNASMGDNVFFEMRAGE
ncbi:GNAT family N-acetyltransferase [Rhizobium setariae]|uniref:GNAT family N-acetyltransferase n=1 Tax=Rhizobium setariae TaxID=2801340 RepID=UPI0031B9B428